MSEQNYLVKCTRSRCRHVHPENQRVLVPEKGRPGSKLSTCPNCGGDSVYHLVRGKRGGMVPARTSNERAEYLTVPAEREVAS